MDWYLEVCILPNPEIASAHVMNALMGKLHQALVDLRCDDVGISFPRADAKGLGDVLRLHGAQERLSALRQLAWPRSLLSYLMIKEVRPVPTDATHCLVRRVQIKSSVERLRRRQIKRHGWSKDEAKNRIPDTVAKQSNLPFLSLHSSSTRQPFRLFIERVPSPTRVAGKFNTYGLSQSATVPCF